MSVKVSLLYKYDWHMTSLWRTHNVYVLCDIQLIIKITVKFIYICLSGYMKEILMIFRVIYSNVIDINIAQK
jgi:hypothetical protein